MYCINTRIFQLLNTASRKYLAVNAGETSRTETTNLKVRPINHIRCHQYSIFLICRWSSAQRTLRAVSLKFCRATRCILLEMRCATPTKPSLRVSELKVNFCTARVVAIGTNSPSLNNGLSMHGAKFVHSHVLLRFELNLISN